MMIRLIPDDDDAAVAGMPGCLCTLISLSARSQAREWATTELQMDGCKPVVGELKKWQKFALTATVTTTATVPFQIGYFRELPTHTAWSCINAEGNE